MVVCLLLQAEKRENLICWMIKYSFVIGCTEAEKRASLEDLFTDRTNYEKALAEKASYDVN